MKILIAGSSGLVGTALTLFLIRRGHKVSKLVRRHPTQPYEIFWDPEHQKLNPTEIEGFDAIVNLAGESIAEGRWTAAKKLRILESRLQPTKLLVDTIAKLKQKPLVLVNASAVGYYGETGSETVTESSRPGSDFLADVCVQWERAADPVVNSGVRLVKLRTGMVLAAEGGALKKMLLPFKLGLGGVIGSGKQYISWIMINDLLAIIEEAIVKANYSGAVNVVSGAPVTNREFTKTLGDVLRRPTILPMPAFMAKVVFGEVAEPLLLGSCRVAPEKLQGYGYKFLFPKLHDALGYLLKG
jgi:hypothetical protein